MNEGDGFIFGFMCLVIGINFGIWQKSLSAGLFLFVLLMWISSLVYPKG